MSDQHRPHGPDGERRPGDPDVGSVADEALKLFGALADAARQHAGGAAGTVGGLADQASSIAHELGEHIATDSPECRYCPVCRVVHAVRGTSPEVRSHLMVAASSLLQAAAGLMETMPPPAGRDAAPPRGQGVEHIDLDADLDDDLDDDPHDDPDDQPGAPS